jgi:hypothetical protein
MPYTANNPSPSKSVEELRQQIPGWGADLDPADRPSVPRERKDLETGAHWDFPERQEEKRPRERSIEHRFLPPVFGTSVALKGLSGRVRRLAYDRYSEARAAHWLLLLAGDRVDAWESHLRSLASRRPDNPLAETGARGEVHGHGVRSRTGTKRADLAHQWMDPVIVAGPWLLVAAAAAAAVAAFKHRRS